MFSRLLINDIISAMNTKHLFKNMEYVIGALTIIVFFIASAAVIFYSFKVDIANSQRALTGNGSEADPFIIATAEDYVYYADTFNSYDDYYQSACVELANDIHLTEEQADKVLGNPDIGTYFEGVFNGRGHSISGLKYSGDIAGLFPRLGGEVINLSVTDCEFSGDRCGGIAGVIVDGGKIINCCSNAAIAGELTGGICAMNYGTIENCATSSDSVIGKSRLGSKLGDSFDSSASATEAAAKLNENLIKLVPINDFCRWDVFTDKPSLTTDTALTVKSLGVKAIIGGREETIYGFFSRPLRQWCIALPQGCRQDTYTCEAVLSDGRSISAAAACNDTAITLDELNIPVSFYFYQDISTMMIDFYSDTELQYLHRDKTNYTGASLQIYDSELNMINRDMNIILNGHGNDSFKADKTSFSIKLSESNQLDGMASGYEYVLLAAHRDNCLFNYIFTRDLHRELNMSYPHEYRLINLYFNGEYQGIYFLTRKMEISESSFDLKNLKEETSRMNSRLLSEYPMASEGDSYWYEIPNIPEDVTGGYLMELNNTDWNPDKSRFKTTGGNIYTSKGDRYLNKEQLSYIRDYFQDYEDAVRSNDGYNAKGKYYSDYIDLESFADQWILYELTMDISNVDSVYFYKDSDYVGNGKLHGVWNWDVEHSFTALKQADEHYLMKEYESKGKESVYVWLYKHEDFREMLSKEWKEKFSPAIEKTLSDTVIDNSQGLGTIEWYKQQYPDSTFINDLYYDDTSYIGKCDLVDAILRKRLNTLNMYFK